MTSPFSQAWSEVRSFKVPAPQSSPFPLSLAVFADVATSIYTAINIDNMIKLQPDIVLLAGDLPYADLYQGAKSVGIMLRRCFPKGFPLCENYGDKVYYLPTA